MNKELIKTVRSEKPETNYNKDRYLIRCYGTGERSGNWKIEKSWSVLDDVDIVLLAYFADRDYHKDIEKWGTEWFYKDIDKGPLAFILPYMYDDNELEVFDDGWEDIARVELFWCDSDGVLWEEKLPKVTDIFDNIDEFIQYVKEQMKIIRPDYEDEEGVMVRPWEIDEAREVLKQHGWNNQELRYLRWIGNDRAFGACIEVPQMYADYMIKKFDETNEKEKFVLNVLLKGLRAANKKCKCLGWNGPNGMCGTYIYRANEQILQENDYIDEENIVRMPDGRIYILHEGD